MAAIDLVLVELSWMRGKLIWIQNDGGCVAIVFHEPFILLSIAFSNFHFCSSFQLDSANVEVVSLEDVLDAEKFNARRLAFLGQGSDTPAVPGLMINPTATEFLKNRKLKQSYVCLPQQCFLLLSTVKKFRLGQTPDIVGSSARVSPPPSTVTTTANLKQPQSPNDLNQFAGLSCWFKLSCPITTIPILQALNCFGT